MRDELSAAFVELSVNNIVKGAFGVESPIPNLLSIKPAPNELVEVDDPLTEPEPNTSIEPVTTKEPVTSAVDVVYSICVPPADTLIKLPAFVAFTPGNPLPTEKCPLPAVGF